MKTLIVFALISTVIVLCLVVYYESQQRFSLEHQKIHEKSLAQPKYLEGVPLT